MTGGDGAGGTLEAITRQAAVLHAELQRAVEIFVHGAPDTEATDVPSAPVDVAVLELTVDGWRHLVPTESTARGALGALMHQRFGDTLRSFPLVLGAVGRSDLATDLASGRADAVATGGDTDRAALARALQRVDLAAGTTLFAQGDPGDSLYVIVRGRLRLVITDAAGDALFRELGPGQTVGELALLTGDPRNGTVVAIRDAVVYRLGRNEFDRTARSHPDVTRTMLATLAGRLNHPQVRGDTHAPPQHIAVVSVGVNGCGRELAEALARTMDREVPTALVTSASIDAAVGDGAVDADPASPLGVRVQLHLDELEERHRHLVLVADEGVTPWSLKCVREADLVLLVGRAGAAPTPTRLEEAVFDVARPITGARRHLVVVEPTAAGTPAGTDRWLRTRDVDRCHHVHLGSPEHLSRLARFVTGTPVGLALSGGAVRAFAHLGVLRALGAAGIPVDIIVATSAGAVVGAQLAMGLDPDRISELDQQAFGGLGRMLLDVVPFTSVFGGTRFNAVLEGLFGDVRFEDLWLQFACTTTDLTAAQPRLHQRGPLRPFIRASCSLPMVFPPVIHEGHLLADGGIVNNLPVDPLLGMGRVGLLIAVNVTSTFYDADEAYNYQDNLTLARVLNGRLNPFAERLVAPGMLDVLMRSLEIGSKSVETAQAAKADLYIRPDVSHFGYTDVAAMAAIVAAGEAATRDRLAEFGAPVVAFTR